jgi:hypothetical protein
MRYYPDMGQEGPGETKKPEIGVVSLQFMNLGSAE